MVIKNRKGFFFTVIIIIVLSLLLLSSTFYVQAQYRESIQKRVSTMNNYVTSTETDIERQMYLEGYRIILLMENSMINKTMQPIQNPESLFTEGFFNGTINSVPQDLLSDVKFGDYLADLNANANKMNLMISITNATVNLTQEDPWRIAIILKANFFMKDSSNLAQWNKTLLIKSYIPIDRFEDPTYLINTNGRLSNKFKQTPYTFLSSTDMTNLSLHLANSYYIASPLAPSFIDRLKGNLTAQSPYGVESLVNLQKLSLQGIAVDNTKSIVDYIYFNSTNNPASCSKPGLPGWFRIDSANAQSYNLSC